MKQVGSEQWAVGSQKVKRSWGFVTLFAFLAALAIPVFAHGCHAGDHDEEPAIAPIERGANDDAQFPGPRSR